MEYDKTPTRAINETDDAAAQERGARLDDGTHGRSEQSLHFLRQVREIRCDCSSLFAWLAKNESKPINKKHCTNRVLLLVEPLNVVSQGGSEQQHPQLGRQIPSGLSHAKDLSVDGNGSEDSRDKVP